ncbi:glycosyltransferase, MGT family [Agrococcus baldri]|uniref:Glycosyltransferase, MGT family n=1 Tax=Agrococcus baldri TaxID=153730 RepID=A0AA94HLU2_9MICO|nr:glycosyltransferase [Agrococcus baldri]SFS08480.1 glycosyltransferase, MGT family [Agrococcus baldri]
MATIAAYTSPALGHVLPFAGVLLELQRRGHRIRIRTLSSEVGRMRDLGFEADAVDASVAAVEFDDWRSRRVLDNYRRMCETFSERARHEAPDMRALIGQAQPDLLLTDVNTWGAAAVAESTGLPWVSLATYPPAMRSRGCPPYGPGLTPANGLGGRLRDALIDRLIYRPAMRTTTPMLNALRAEIARLPPVDSYDAMVRRAPLTLVTTAEPLEYRHDDWAPRLQLVGPTAWEPPAPAPAWLAEVDRPIVLVATATEYQGDTDIVRVALDALADEPVTVVATMAHGARLGAPLPRNARIERFVPHSVLLERATVAVTHGGLGVTQKALAHGVPVVAVPYGRDQLEIAARVQHAGAGVRLHRSRLTPERLRGAVHRARGMRAGVAAVAAGLEAAGGAPRAADLIEERLQASAPV